MSLRLGRAGTIASAVVGKQRTTRNPRFEPGFYGNLVIRAIEATRLCNRSHVGARRKCHGIAAGIIM